LSSKESVIIPVTSYTRSKNYEIKTAHYISDERTQKIHHHQYQSLPTDMILNPFSPVHILRTNNGIPYLHFSRYYCKMV